MSLSGDVFLSHSDMKMKGVSVKALNITGINGQFLPSIDSPTLGTLISGGRDK